jgi:hypothetical protein
MPDLSPTLLRAFYIEIEKQCRFALIAANDMNVALQSYITDLLFYSIQALLVSIANVSKLLWPGAPRIPNRGSQLRTKLRIGANSAIRLRTFRDHFEHYDERLELWASSSARHNIVDTSVLPPGSIQGLDPGDFMRNFDPTAYSVTFRGDTYPLRPVIAEVQTLWKRVITEINRPFTAQGSTP